MNPRWPNAKPAIPCFVSSPRAELRSAPILVERPRVTDNHATLIPLVLAERARRADQAMRDELYAGCDRAPFNWEHRNAG